MSSDENSHIQSADQRACAHPRRTPLSSPPETPPGQEGIRAEAARRGVALQWRGPRPDLGHPHAVGGSTSQPGTPPGSSQVGVSCCSSPRPAHAAQPGPQGTRDASVCTRQGGSQSPAGPWQVTVHGTGDLMLGNEGVTNHAALALGARNQHLHQRSDPTTPRDSQGSPTLKSTKLPTCWASPRAQDWLLPQQLSTYPLRQPTKTLISKKTV